jgi:hypothetical protein
MSTPKPKLGAPYGNKNRQSHGRYTRQPLSIPTNPSLPQADLPPSASPGEALPAKRLTLTQEISYLRAYILRTAIIGAATYDIELTKGVLHALSLANTALTRLIHTENWLSQTSGAQVQIDDLPCTFNRLQKISMQVLESLPRRFSPSTALDPQEDKPPVSSLLKNLAHDLGIDLNNDLAAADFPAPAPKLPTDSSDHASDIHSSLDRLTRN